jgi:MFS family permease
MDQKQPKTLRFNYLVNMLDGSFYGFAIGFASFTTVIPLFVSNLTNSAFLIGLIPAIHNMGWQLPQLLTVRRLAQSERIKPTVLLMTLHERFPFLALAVIAWFIPALTPSFALALIFFVLIWQGLGAGITANPWMNMIAKIIPADNRATFFGIQSSAANLLASIGALIAGILLQRIAYPHNFFSCFILASLCLVISYFFISRTREAPNLSLPPAMDNLAFRDSIHQVLKNVPFRWFLVMRIVSQFCLMAFSFLIVFGVRKFGMSDVTAGVMTSTLLISEVIANPLLGWFSDRVGRKLMLQIGALSGFLSVLIALLAEDINWFYLVMVFSGIASTAFYTIVLAYSLEFGTESERATYVGLGNTLIAPFAIIAPLLGGWMADAFGFSSTFTLAAVAGILTFLILQLFMQENSEINESFV